MFDEICASLVDAAVLVRQSIELPLNFGAKRRVRSKEKGVVDLFEFELGTVGVLRDKVTRRDAHGVSATDSVMKLRQFREHSRGNLK